MREPISEATRELPLYKGDKEVRALRISAIEWDKPDDPKAEPAGATITVFERGYAPIHVDAALLRKHKPQVGDYYVVLMDGQETFSPGKAFEKRYTKV